LAVNRAGAASRTWANPTETFQAAQFDSRYRYRVLLWRKCVLWTVGAYLIMNGGFEMVRIPPVGAGIPIGELALVVSLCILNPLTILPKMSRVVWLFPILLWWMLSLPRSLFDTTVGGVWAFRDASQAIESLYLIVGFGLVNSVDNVRYFFAWLRKVLLFIAFYGLLFPVSKTLQKLSPSLPHLGSATGSTGLFFQMVNTPSLMLISALWLMLEKPRSERSIPWNTLWAACLIAFATAFGQSRTEYLQIVLLGVLLMFLKWKAAVRWYAMLAFGCLLIAVVAASGLGLTGREGNKISLDFIVKHFVSSSGSGAAETEGAAEGVSKRIRWWRHIYAEISESPYNEAFGLGYGRPLTDFKGPTGVVAREPHNSFISVGARLGITGAVAWGLMQAGLYVSWRRTYKLAKQFNWIHAQNNLLLLVTFCFFLVVTGLGEDGFEKPFWAIPYYLFFGVALRYGMMLREHPELQH